jgi:hypothetical protein
MKYRTRVYYTAEQKAEMWDRGLAEKNIPGEREPSGVTRDNLQKPVYSGAGRPEKGIAPIP